MIAINPSLVLSSLQVALTLLGFALHPPVSALAGWCWESASWLDEGPSGVLSPVAGAA